MTAYELIYSNEGFLPLLVNAVVTAASNIRYEDVQTENHAARLAWAVRVSADPKAMALALRGFVAQHVATTGTLDQATVQAGVDGSIAAVIPV